MPRPRSDIRPRLIEAARSRFLAEGVDGASLRSIASDAGTNIGMVYYYFQTKDDLFMAVVQDVYTDLFADLTAVLGNSDHDHETRLRKLFGRIAAMTDTEFTVVRILIREALGTSDRLAPIVELFAKGHLPLVAGAVMQAANDGVLTTRHSPPVSMAALVSLGALPQILRRVLLARAPQAAPLIPDAETLASMMFETALRGLGPEAGPKAGDSQETGG